MTKLLEKKPRIYIIATLTFMDRENLTHDLSFFATDHPRLSWKTGTGFYRGEREPIVAIIGVATHEAATIARFAKQDTFLVIAENDRQCYEVDATTGYHRALGVLEVLEAPPSEGRPYTQIDGTIYAACGKRRGKDLPHGL